MYYISFILQLYTVNKYNGNKGDLDKIEYIAFYYKPFSPIHTHIIHNTLHDDDNLLRPQPHRLLVPFDCHNRCMRHSEKCQLI